MIKEINKIHDYKIKKERFKIQGDNCPFCIRIIIFFEMLYIRRFRYVTMRNYTRILIYLNRLFLFGVCMKI